MLNGDSDSKGFVKTLEEELNAFKVTVESALTELN